MMPYGDAPVDPSTNTFRCFRRAYTSMVVLLELAEQVILSDQTSSPAKEWYMEQKRSQMEGLRLLPSEDKLTEVENELRALHTFNPTSILSTLARPRAPHDGKGAHGIDHDGPMAEVRSGHTGVGLPKWHQTGQSNQGDGLARIVAETKGLNEKEWRSRCIRAEALLKESVDEHKVMVKLVEDVQEELRRVKEDAIVETKEATKVFEKRARFAESRLVAVESVATELRKQLDDLRSSQDEREKATRADAEELTRLSMKRSLAIAETKLRRDYEAMKLDMGKRVQVLVRKIQRINDTSVGSMSISHMKKHSLLCNMLQSYLFMSLFGLQALLVPEVLSVFPVDISTQSSNRDTDQGYFPLREERSASDGMVDNDSEVKDVASLFMIVGSLIQWLKRQPTLSLLRPSPSRVQPDDVPSTSTSTTRLSLKDLPKVPSTLIPQAMSHDATPFGTSAVSFGRSQLHSSSPSSPSPSTSPSATSSSIPAPPPPHPIPPRLSISSLSSLALRQTPSLPLTTTPVDALKEAFVEILLKDDQLYERAMRIDQDLDHRGSGT